MKLEAFNICFHSRFHGPVVEAFSYACFELILLTNLSTHLLITKLGCISTDNHSRKFELLFRSERIHFRVRLLLQTDVCPVLSYLLPRELTLWNLIVPSDLMMQALIRRTVLGRYGHMHWPANVSIPVLSSRRVS